MTETFQGLAEAKKKLEQLTPKQMRATERTAIRAGAVVVQKAAIRRAPRRTGILRAKKIGVSVSVNAEKSEATIGTSRVGMFLELGTKYMRARPFLRPALEESEPAIVARYVDVFKAQIAKFTNG